MGNMKHVICLVLCFSKFRLTEEYSLDDLNGEKFANILQQLAEKIGVNEVQTKYDETPYSMESLDGKSLITELSQTVSIKFLDNIQAAENIRSIIQQHYNNFTRQLKDKLCCKLQPNHLEYDPKFKTSVSKTEFCVVETTTTTPNPTYVNDEVLQIMKNNFQNNPSLKWQYFGTEEGVFFNYPANKFSSCDEYDHRYRPWYVEAATPVPKDVVIVIDRSGSMNGAYHRGQRLIDIARDAAKTVLGTMNPRDRVGIVTFNHGAHTPPGNKNTDDCFSSQLAQATPQNLKYLKEYLDTLTPTGSTKYIGALEQAFGFLSNARHSDDKRDQVILFLSDGFPDEQESVSNILETVNYLNKPFNNSVIIMTYGIGLSAVWNDKDQPISKLLADMANQTGYDPSYGIVKPGNYTKITDPSKLRVEMGSYYNFFSQSQTEAIISIPYFDAFGLGLITTVALPVHHNGNLLGIVGVDISMSEILSDVTYFQEGDFSYAFMIDSQGRTMMHPLLPRPNAIHESPIFVDISDLEQDAQVTTVLQSMKDGESGDHSFTSTHVLSRGSVLTEGVETKSLLSHYYWHPIRGTNFSVCVVLAAVNLQPELPSMTLPEDQTFQYHDLFVRRVPTPCKFFKRYATNTSSCVKFSPFAFLEPYSYLDGTETNADIDRYEQYFKGNVNIKPPVFKSHVRSAVEISRVVESVWLDDSHTVQSAIWRYFGTIEGALRLYPATTLAKIYDHTLRPWYIKSLNNRGLNILTAPYNDAWGAGYVVTLCHTIYQGSITGQHTPNDLIAGVMGIDFTLGSIYTKMTESNPVCSSSEFRCFIVDNSGYIIIHPDFVNSDVKNASEIENVHLIQKLPIFAKELINAGIMIREACVDYETIREQYYWKVTLSKDYHSRLGKQILKAVPGTNLFMGIYNKGSEQSHNDCYHCEQKNSHCKSSRAYIGFPCECPCYHKANFAFCLNSYSSYASSNIPPCTPHNSEPPYSIESEQSKIQNLPRCFDKKCHERNEKTQCFGVSGCRWCNTSSCLYHEELCTYGSLSAGAIAGITAGVIVGIIAIIIIILVAVVRRRRLQKANGERRLPNIHTDRNVCDNEHTYQNPQLVSDYEEPTLERIHRQNADNTRQRSLSEPIYHNPTGMHYSSPRGIAPVFEFSGYSSPRNSSILNTPSSTMERNGEANMYTTDIPPPYLEACNHTNPYQNT